MSYYSSDGPVRALIALQFADGSVRWATGIPREYEISTDDYGPAQLTMRMFVDGAVHEGPPPSDVNAAMRPAARIDGPAPALPPAVRRLPPGSPR